MPDEEVLQPAVRDPFAGDTYDARMACQNCGWYGVRHYRKGVPVRDDERCPNCRAGTLHRA
jgi:hypothetical protein